MVYLEEFMQQTLTSYSANIANTANIAKILEIIITNYFVSGINDVILIIGVPKFSFMPYNFY